MLALIATRIPAPAVEAVDRDPGLITLAFAVVRGLRRRTGAVRAAEGGGGGRAG